MWLFNRIINYFKNRKPVVRPAIRKSFERMGMRRDEKIRTARKAQSFFNSRASVVRVASITDM